jgi:hypothetical protein
MKIKHTSLLPLPNPLITLPSSLSGKGASGPESGPAVGSRGPSGRMVFVFWLCFLRFPLMLGLQIGEDQAMRVEDLNGDVIVVGVCYVVTQQFTVLDV